MIRSLNLLSGGLDSTLSIRVLQEQGIEVTGLCFKTPFFGENNAKKAAEQLGIKLIVKEVSDEHLEIIKNPKHGHGKNMNPCIDCHGFMFKKAKEIMEEEGFDIIATGEVLGQRPMSQNSKSLKIVEKIAGLEDKILRPLSALVLPETEYEKKGLVDRKKLLDLKGKGRKPQLELAKKFGIKEFPSPAGGCKLTTKEFSDKLRTLLQKHPEAKSEVMGFMQVGRHIWVDDTLIIVARDKEDSDKMETLQKPEHFFIKMKDIPGPHAITLFLDDKDVEEIKKKAIEQIFKFKRIKERNIVFICEYLGEKKEFIF